jgi:hypothetical protein
MKMADNLFHAKEQKAQRKYGSMTDRVGKILVANLMSLPCQ